MQIFESFNSHFVSSSQKCSETKQVSHQITKLWSPPLILNQTTFKYSHRPTWTLWCLSVWDIETNLRMKWTGWFQNCNAGSFSRLKRVVEFRSTAASTEGLKPCCELEDQRRRATRSVFGSCVGSQRRGETCHHV